MEYTFYRIFSRTPGVTECYIGSTKDLNDRKTTHKCQCNNIDAEKYNIKLYQFIRSNGGFDAFEFEIIDTIIFSETDRFIHENKLMDLYGSTLNAKRAIITDRKEKNKQYRDANKEKIKEYTKQYREANKEHKKEIDKQYREANKEKIKEYREANKEKSKEYKHQYYLKKKAEKNV